jgi:CRP/FNR family transcriptional regulator
MDDLSSLVARLGSVRHFARLPEADLRVIVQSGQVRRFRAGETIFHEGDPCSGMHVLLQGQVQLRKLGPEGQVTIMGLIEPVIMFNEVAVLDGGTNPITALALQDSLAWQVGYDSFQSLLGRYPVIGLGLLRVLAARNRLLMTHYEDLAFRTVVGRAAKLLLDLSQAGTRPISRREHSIQDLASQAATVRETFSRVLNTFKQDGLVASTPTWITVLQPAGLAKLAQVNLKIHLE